MALSSEQMRREQDDQMPPDWFTRPHRIDLKRIPKMCGKDSLTKIVPKSPFHLKQEVERFAYYFGREFRFVAPFRANPEIFDDPYTAYLLPSPDSAVWVGACCFVPESLLSFQYLCESLFWVWLHPYYRGRGILKTHWATLRTNHGDFWVEPPLSSAMKGFLLKNNRDSAFYPVLADDKPDYEAIRAKLRENPFQRELEPVDPETADFIAKAFRPIQLKNE
jgi:hypothetical protein